MKTYIKYLRTPTDDDKLGPQEKACMNAVAKAAGDKAGERALRTDVIEALTAGGQLVQGRLLSVNNLHSASGARPHARSSAA